MDTLESLAMRSEQEIFDDLAFLCAKPGYAHAIAYFCFRDHTIGVGDELHTEDYAKLFSFERLIRTEISLLIGLMIRSSRDWSLPDQETLQTNIDQTEALLKELHEALQEPIVKEMKELLTNPERITDRQVTAREIREPIFYGGESAYAFQYRDLACRKYQRDSDWLRKNKSFSPDETRTVVAAISSCLEEKLLATLEAMRTTTPDQWTILDGFAFTAADVVALSGLPQAAVKAVIDAFTFAEDGNGAFVSLNAFNAANAYPILKRGNDEYILFLQTNLAEAFYETPFYWMIADAIYRAEAMKHRGLFTEDFTAERLERVFGQSRVFRNVDIWDGEARKQKLGEIDTLALFADRALVVQDKSKKLTIEARKGNDLQLQADFKAAVQDACDQALACSGYLLQGTAPLTDPAGNEVALQYPLKQIHPVCVVSDHYPALTLQASKFLKFSTTDTIKTPLVCDVFFIDEVTEFLDNPLRCLSYFELRAMAGNDVIMAHEHTALAFHLKRNLWLGEYNGILLEDDLAIDLEVAMTVRRGGLPGARTPPGILTELNSTTIGRIIEELEGRSDPAAVALGLELLKLSGPSALDLSRGIDKIAVLWDKDGKEHDVSVASSTAKSGLTVHCNRLPHALAGKKLRQHCELRKYSVKANRWFGLAIEPTTATVRFGLVLDYPWQQADVMDEAVSKMPKVQSIESLRSFSRSRASPRKLGRNEPCHCGSGLKYKRCHLREDRNET
jgi:hypothetical protein